MAGAVYIVVGAGSRGCSACGAAQRGAAVRVTVLLEVGGSAPALVIRSRYRSVRVRGIAALRVTNITWCAMCDDGERAPT